MTLLGSCSQAELSLFWIPVTLSFISHVLSLSRPYVSDAQAPSFPQNCKFFGLYMMMWCLTCSQKCQEMSQSSLHTAPCRPPAQQELVPCTHAHRRTQASFPSNSSLPRKNKYGSAQKYLQVIFVCCQYKTLHNKGPISHSYFIWSRTVTKEPCPYYKC